MQRIGVVLMCFLLGACLKQKDETASGPKAYIALVNAALDSDPVSLYLDGTSLNPVPVAFGQISGDSANTYLASKPGILNTFWQVGTAPVANEKFVQWAPGAHYTLITYDTAVGNIAPVLLVTDNPVVVDTLAKARFINCIAGDMPLNLWLIGTNDTTKLATRSKALSNGGGVTATFDGRIRPGTWRMELSDTSGQVIYQEDIELQPKTLYSFVGFGEFTGTGTKQPVVRNIIQQP